MLDIAGLYAAGSPAGDGSVDVTVTVKVRRGADGSSAGKLSVPPAGTTVVVVTPGGQTYDGATTDGGGIFKLHAAANPPSGSRITAPVSTGVGPAAGCTGGNCIGSAPIGCP